MKATLLFSTTILAACQLFLPPKPEVAENLVPGSTEKVIPLQLSSTVFFEETRQGMSLVKRRLRMRGWDFNNDGAYDMVDLYKNDGSLERRSFDLNFDGKVDKILYGDP